MWETERACYQEQFKTLKYVYMVTEGRDGQGTE